MKNVSYSIIIQNHDNVQNICDRDLGMDRSLFVELDDTGGTYELNLQYRMNR